jgi:hypothetical protein
MSALPTYHPRIIKRRRATKDQANERRARLVALAREKRPATVRQIFYAATVEGLVEKTEQGYATVKSDLTLLRRSGAMPYKWLADNTRWQRKPDTFSSIADALNETARFYRKALWADAADSYVEVWLEKDALSGTVYPVTAEFDVPLMVARGYASLSFLDSAAEQIRTLNRPAYIYHLGDFDPSGVNAGEKIDQTLREMAPAAEIHFERLAVLPQQITAWRLPTRPTKQTDTRAKRFGDNESVELDAIDPPQLRKIVQDAIERHLPEDKLKVLQVAEENERAAFRNIAHFFAVDPEAFIGDGSGSGDPIGLYEERLDQLKSWIDRGAPLPPDGER